MENNIEFEQELQVFPRADERFAALAPFCEYEHHDGMFVVARVKASFWTPDRGDGYAEGGEVEGVEFIDPNEQVITGELAAALWEAFRDKLTKSAMKSAVSLFCDYRN